ncbi:FAD/NAD(P)-binding protein [Jiulongibacter sp. NS-SX5]|uniref:FAD/NAD(P)-binding protein n=1 Tax=Jiulongibacter sp. NS-SX5 TaxID=3463854 RepID=UPI0040584BF0
MRTLAVIGCGPRGGFALEQFFQELILQGSIENTKILAFESTGLWGSGWVYYTKQSDANWININERNIDLPSRPLWQIRDQIIPKFPSYHQWAGFENRNETDPDNYIKRSRLGEYLTQRFESFATPMCELGVLQLIDTEVKHLQFQSDNTLILNCQNGEVYKVNEALLTIGHQSTSLDKDLEKWHQELPEDQIDNKLILDPYPLENYLNSPSISTAQNIGIRGMGLAMIDVVRTIASLHGEFEIEDKSSQKMKFKSSKRNTKILPYSLDGLPPIPKPLNKAIDDNFLPNQKELDLFDKSISNKATQKKAKNSQFLLSAFAKLATRVFKNHPHQKQNSIAEQKLEVLIIQWLKEQKHDHPLFVPKSQPIIELLKLYAEMACGVQPSSLDYAIGQIWKHCQPTIYKALSYSLCSDEVIAEIIKIDESTKRYSFGPPVASIQQLIALVEAGFIDFSFANNPEVVLENYHWHISKEGKSRNVDVLINSVLDQPQIEKVNSPLVAELLNCELAKPVHDALGVSTSETAYLINQVENEIPNIALLGRLAKGTVVGVDAILECFGERPKQWAKEAARRHLKKI